MAATPALHLTLHPHRSLGRQGFQRLMLVVGAVSALGALRFMVLGAWPVALFFLIDALGLYIAFKISYARARAFEELQIADGWLTVRQVSHDGRTRLHRFNAYWAKVILQPVNVVQNRLLLVAQGRSLEIGHFLPASERAEVKMEIEKGLRACRP